MAPKGATIWDNAALLNDLVVNLYEAANQASGLGPTVKEAIVESLHQQEHELSWEAIRRLLDRTAAMASVRQNMKWDPIVHEDILMALFQHVTLASEHWVKVMDELRAKGYMFSENALRQHVQKLRKNRDVSGINKAAAGAATPTKTTPAKPASARKRKTPSKKNAKEFSPFDGDDEDEVKDLLKREDSDENLDGNTPSKKLKRENDELRKRCKQADAAEAADANEI